MLDDGREYRRCLQEVQEEVGLGGNVLLGLEGSMEGAVGGSRVWASGGGVTGNSALQ